MLLCWSWIAYRSVPFDGNREEEYQLVNCRTNVELRQEGGQDDSLTDTHAAYLATIDALGWLATHVKEHQTLKPSPVKALVCSDNNMLIQLISGSWSCRYEGNFVSLNHRSDETLSPLLSKAKSLILQDGSVNYEFLAIQKTKSKAHTLLHSNLVFDPNQIRNFVGPLNHNILVQGGSIQQGVPSVGLPVG